MEGETVINIMGLDYELPKKKEVELLKTDCETVELLKTDCETVELLKTDCETVNNTSEMEVLDENNINIDKFLENVEEFVEMTEAFLKWM